MRMEIPFSVTDAMVSWLARLGYNAATRRYDNSPAELVTVTRTGGRVLNLIDRPVIALQFWAGTEERAESMANEARLALLTTCPPPGIHSVSVNTGPYPFFDAYSRSPRYQLVLDVSCQLTIETDRR